jgi:predicted KAP-like P-loop ATPase
VDELDRCEPSEVLRTLTQIKTFLDEDGCAFVVAADRDALMSALATALPSSSADKPVAHETSTYSFVDKVFQHQLSLPPASCRNAGRLRLRVGARSRRAVG